MCRNNYPRACALGYERVSPLQDFSLSIDVNTMCIIVGFFLWVSVAPLQDLFIFDYVIIYIYYFMRLHWLALRRGLTESAIIRIFAKI